MTCDKCKQIIQPNQLVYDVATCCSTAHDAEDDGLLFDPQYEVILCESCSRTITFKEMLQMEMPDGNQTER